MKFKVGQRLKCIKPNDFLVGSFIEDNIYTISIIEEEFGRVYLTSEEGINYYFYTNNNRITCFLLYNHFKSLTNIYYLGGE